MLQTESITALCLSTSLSVLSLLLPIWKLPLASRVGERNVSKDNIERQMCRGELPWSESPFICTVAQLHSRTPMAHTPVWCKCGDKVSPPFLYTHPRRPQTQVTTLCSTRKYSKCVHRAIIWPWLGKQGGSRSRVSPLWKQSRVPS